MRLALGCLLLVGAALVLGAVRQLSSSPPEPVPLIELGERGPLSREPARTPSGEAGASGGGAQVVSPRSPAPAGGENRKDASDERRPDGENGDDG